MIEQRRHFLVLASLILIAYTLCASNNETISITFDGDPGTISCTPSPLRYDKKHAITFDQDDNLRGVYKALFPLFMGGTPALYVSGVYYDQAVSAGRFFNDGFGNQIPFKSNSVSWVMTVNTETGETTDYWEWATGYPAGGRLGYPDLQDMLDNGFGISSHGYYKNIMDGLSDDTVALCPTFYRNWLEKNTGYLPLSFDQPGGTTYNTDLWISKWFDLGAIYGVLGSGGGYAPVRVDNVDHSSLTGPIITARYSLESKTYNDLKATIDQLMAEDYNKWLRCYSHNIQEAPTTFLDYDAFVQFTQYMEDTYADDLWVPGISEIISYFHVRDNVSFSTLAGSTANEKTIEINTANIPINIKDRKLTFELSSSQAISSIDFNGHPANYKSLGDNTYLIDIDLSYEREPVSTPEITGYTEVPEFRSGVVYSVTPISGGTYEWIITGDASIVSGAGTYSITVDMGEDDPEIQVRVANTDGSAAYDEISVTTTHIHYVKPIASGDGSGSSWANADDDLQAAINDGNADQIWLAAGTYYVPDSDGFNLVNGTSIYGGFIGTESDTSERALSDLNTDGTISPWEYTNPSILSGDLDRATNPDNYSSWPDNIGTSMDGNADHVVYQSANFDDPTQLNGLSILGGNANGASSELYRGGGIYQRKNVLIKNCQFLYNLSSNQGGAIYNYQSNIVNSYIAYNRALVDGGGVHNDNGNVSGCWITNNYAENKGGGINNYGASSSLTNSKTYNNTTNSIGGGIHNYLGEISYTQAYSNTSAGNGGGMYLDQGHIEHCSVYENTSNGSGTGGGIYSYRGSVYNCEIYRNEASAGGGGILMRGDSLVNSVIYDNQTTLSYARGGGLTIQDATDQGIAVNTIIFNNQSLNLGGGVYNDNADLINCTVVNNYSTNDAGGIYNNSSATVINTAIWGNGSADQDPQINAAGIISYSASQGSAPTGTGNIALSSANAVDGTSPYFVLPTSFVGLSNDNATYESELENADWDIASTSVLKDAGTNVGAPETDIDGGVRSATDIGAYENGAEPATPICLKSFEANFEQGIINLTWITASETENAAFNLYKNNKLIASIAGHGTSTEEHVYTYTDNDIVVGTYTYILADVNYQGEENRMIDEAVNITISENNLLPTSYALADAFPNPFNPSTTLGYSLKTTADVDLFIFDLSGKVVKSWDFSQQSPGWYPIIWNGKNSQGFNLSSGIYFYTIKANDFVQTKKMIMMK